MARSHGAMVRVKRFRMPLYPCHSQARPTNLPEYQKAGSGQTQYDARLAVGASRPVPRRYDVRSATSGSTRLARQAGPAAAAIAAAAKIATTKQSAPIWLALTITTDASQRPA
jgi:hypothetical protein